MSKPAGFSRVRDARSVITVLICAWFAANDVQAASTDSIIVAWGNNDFGQTTVPPEAQTGVTAIAAGQSYTLCLKDNGSVLAWGDNRAGQTALPAAVGNSVKAISAGGVHALVLRSDGS